MTCYDGGNTPDEELIMYDVFLRLQQEEHHSTLSLSEILWWMKSYWIVKFGFAFF
jgi:hypothetical protein